MPLETAAMLFFLAGLYLKQGIGWVYFICMGLLKLQRAKTDNSCQQRVSNTRPRDNEATTVTARLADLIQYRQFQSLTSRQQVFIVLFKAVHHIIRQGVFIVSFAQYCHYITWVSCWCLTIRYCQTAKWHPFYITSILNTRQSKGTLSRVM